MERKMREFQVKNATMKIMMAMRLSIWEVDIFWLTFDNAIKVKKLGLTCLKISASPWKLFFNLLQVMLNPLKGFHQRHLRFNGIIDAPKKGIELEGLIGKYNT